MHLDQLLTKEFLYNSLVNNKISIMSLAVKIKCCKHTIIKYCKKFKIYDEVKSISSIASGKTKDLIGLKFSNLTVLKLGPNDSFGKKRWLCVCSCGREKLVNAASLQRGLTKTCGVCAEWHNFKGYEQISGAYWRKLEDNAEKRGFEFSLKPQNVWDLFLIQNKKCALSNVEIRFQKNQDKGSLQTASVDRIDSSLGYTIDNIQLIHKRVQRIKDILSNQELVLWCKKIYLNKKELADSADLDLINVGYNDR